MMKYVRGMLVKVKENAVKHKAYGGLFFNDTMLKHIGQWVTIAQVYNGWYSIKEDNMANLWTDDMFEELPKLRATWLPEDAKDVAAFDDNANYQIGDKVTVRNDLSLGDKYGLYRVTSQMLDYRNQTFKVVQVMNCGAAYVLEGLQRYAWAKEMLKPCKEKTILDIGVIKDSLEVSSRFGLASLPIFPPQIHQISIPSGVYWSGKLIDEKKKEVEEGRLTYTKVKTNFKFL